MCPSCQRYLEDTRHFLECDHPERRRLFENLRLQLTATSTKYSLHPSIINVFWLGLLTIRNASPYPNIVQDIPPALRPTIAQQSRIGWDQLYYGRYTKSWATAIDALNPNMALSG